MKYFIYEVIENGDRYEDFLDVETAQEAIDKTEHSWKNLSKSDQKRRSEYSICAVEEQYIDDGCISPDCPGWDVLKSFK